MNSAEWQLARVEGGRILRNPLVWVGFAVSAQWLRAVANDDHVEGRYNLLIGYGLVLPVLVVSTQVVLAVIRARSSGTESLVITLPVGPDRRTIGHALATGVAAVLGVIWTTGAIVALRPSNPLGSVLVVNSRTDRAIEFVALPRPNLAQLLQGPAAAAMVCCLVVALVRWLPSWLVIIPMLFATMMQATFLGLWSGSATGPLDWLSPLPRGWIHDGWVGCGPIDSLCQLAVSGFDRVTPWWHLGYLLTLAGWFVAVATLRHRRDARLWWTFGAMSLAVAFFVVAQCVVYRRYEPVPR